MMCRVSLGSKRSNLIGPLSVMFELSAVAFAELTASLSLRVALPSFSELAPGVLVSSETDVFREGAREDG